MGWEEEVLPSEEVISVETCMKWSELCRTLQKGHLVMVGNSHTPGAAQMALCLVGSRNGMVASAKCHHLERLCSSLILEQDHRYED